MNLLYPKIPGRQISIMLGMTLLGCVIAGAYGVLHDQVTYSISPEYFTRLKFDQFDYAEPANGSERVFAGRIGFLATWWVGGIVAWVFARVGIMREKRVPPFREAITGFAIVFGMSLLAAVCGFGWGIWREGTGHGGGWLGWMRSLGVENTADFMKVAYIHNSSYIGGVIGTIAGCVYMAKMRKQRAAELLAP